MNDGRRGRVAIPGLGLIALCVMLSPMTTLAAPAPVEGAAGAEVYRRACLHCHGADGRGADPGPLVLPVPIPDFTDCQFAPREPDSDWLAVIHEGGPARAFHRMMPAFDRALSDEEARAALRHVRGFCADRSWPRGDLNLPKALITEKAFPEDEVIWLTTIDTEGEGAFSHKVIYEQRFGPRNQIEVVLPIAAHARSGGSWQGGVGDVALGFKRAIAHSFERGSIFSATAEFKLPTGSESNGFGKGVGAFEPFVTFGQILPADSFVQAQAGFEVPFDGDLARDAFWRVAVGKTFTNGRWGRAWTPMVEVLAARELVAGEHTTWDVMPEVQVSLSTRQHILLNVGVRVPVTDSGPRRTQLITYLLWDWFDGGLFAGW